MGGGGAGYSSRNQIVVCDLCWAGREDGGGGGGGGGPTEEASYS